MHFALRGDPYQCVDLEYWNPAGGASSWREMFAATPREEQIERLRHCTYGGRASCFKIMPSSKERMIFFSSGSNLETASNCKRRSSSGASFVFSKK